VAVAKTTRVDKRNAMNKERVLRYARDFSLLIVAILLTSCSTTRESFPWIYLDDPQRTQIRKLEDIHEWSVTGRIAINTDREAVNVSVHWEQQGEDYQIRFNAPLASGAAEIKGNADEVTLRTTDHQTYSAVDPESLLYDVMGWRIPVSGLRYWILGRPAPGVATDEEPERHKDGEWDGKLKRLNQSGWEIRYRTYRRVDGVHLPEHLVLKNEQFDARIRIGTWTLPPAPIDEKFAYKKKSASVSVQESLEERVEEPQPRRRSERVVPTGATKVKTKSHTDGHENPKCGDGGWMASVPLLSHLLEMLPCQSEESVPEEEPTMGQTQQYAPVRESVQIQEYTPREPIREQTSTQAEVEEQTKEWLKEPPEVQVKDWPKEPVVEKPVRVRAEEETRCGDGGFMASIPLLSHVLESLPCNPNRQFEQF